MHFASLFITVATGDVLVTPGDIADTSGEVLGRNENGTGSTRHFFRQTLGVH